MGVELSLHDQSNTGCQVSAYALHKSISSSFEATIENDLSMEYPHRCYANSTDCVTQIDFSPMTPMGIRERLQFNRLITYPTYNLIEFIMDKIEFSSPTLFNPLNISMDFLISTIEDTIVSYEELPVSYNQIMVRGTLRYCTKLLNKIYDYSDKLLVEKTKRFIILIEKLRNQYGVFTTFAHLDLTYIENMFEDIEEEASKKGYLPKLEDMQL